MHTGGAHVWIGKSRLCSVAFFVQLALSGTEAGAASWSEKPFNPKPGSRWLVVSDLDRTETRVENGSRSVVALRKTIKSELTFNAKMPDGGYRITFVRRETKPAGDRAKA